VNDSSGQVWLWGQKSIERFFVANSDDFEAHNCVGIIEEVGKKRKIAHTFARSTLE
jgi:hypothetical protein